MYEKLKESHKKFYYGVIASLDSNFSQPWKKITENRQKVVNSQSMIRRQQCLLKAVD